MTVEQIYQKVYHQLLDAGVEPGEADRIARTSAAEIASMNHKNPEAAHVA
jgi:hypothetical protein